eukprot:m.48793 g.48793  ORF g.48793 m.48793 type:complete len:53 (-) comp10854_c0_seq2:1916-2074(-)
MLWKKYKQYSMMVVVLCVCCFGIIGQEFVPVCLCVIDYVFFLSRKVAFGFVN